MLTAFNFRSQIMNSKIQNLISASPHMLKRCSKVIAIDMPSLIEKNVYPVYKQILHELFYLSRRGVWIYRSSTRNISTWCIVWKFDRVQVCNFLGHNTVWYLNEKLNSLTVWQSHLKNAIYCKSMAMPIQVTVWH